MKIKRIKVIVYWDSWVFNIKKTNRTEYVRWYEVGPFMWSVFYV